MQGVLKQVKKLKDIKLNAEFDDLLEFGLQIKQKVLRKNKSVDIIRSKTHNKLNEEVSEVSEKSRAITIPGLNIEIDDRLKEF